MRSRRSHDLSDHFGELRSLLTQPASTQGWRALTSMLSHWPDVEHLAHVVVPYAKAHLERWDAALRVAPPSWAHALWHDTDAAPYLETLGVLKLEARELSGEALEPRSARLERLAAQLSEVRHLTLREDISQSSYSHVTSFDELLMPYVAAAPCIEELEALTIFMADNATSRLALDTLLETFTQRSTRLARLTLRTEEMSAHSLSRFTAMLDANPYLQRLELYTNGQSDALLHALKLSTTWPPELALSCYGGSNLAAFFGDEATHVHRFTALELRLDAKYREEHIAYVLTHPSLTHLSHLAIDLKMPAAAADAFTYHWARRPEALCELLSLRLSSDRLHASAVRTLGTRGVFENLRTCALADAEYEDPGLPAELARGFTGALEHLSLVHSYHQAEIDLGSLFASPTLHGLKSLTCHHIADRSRGVERLAGMRHLEGLELLSLNSIHIDDAAALQLAASPVLGKVSELSLQHNGLSEIALKALATSHHVYCIEALALSGNVMTSTSASQLARAAWMPNVRELELRRCQLDDVSLRVLLNAPEGSRALDALDLASNALSAHALIELCEHEVVQQLQSLNIYDNDGTGDERFLMYLQQAEHLPEWIRASLIQQCHVTLRSRA